MNRDNHHEQRNIIIILLLLPLGHISNTSRPSPCQLSEPWRKWQGRSTVLVVLVAMGGGALLSLGFEKKGGAAEIFEDEATHKLGFKLLSL